MSNKLEPPKNNTNALTLSNVIEIFTDSDTREKFEKNLTAKITEQNELVRDLNSLPTQKQEMLSRPGENLDSIRNEQGKG